MKILLDRFPCHLAAMPAGVIDEVTDLKSSPNTEGATYVGTTRVIVTEDQVIVAKDSSDGPQIVFREAYDIFIPSDSPMKDSFVVTSSGKMVAFKKDTACGCGSRLRGWNPYKTLTA